MTRTVRGSPWPRFRSLVPILEHTGTTHAIIIAHLPMNNGNGKSHFQITSLFDELGKTCTHTLYRGFKNSEIHLGPAAYYEPVNATQRRTVCIATCTPASTFSMSLEGRHGKAGLHHACGERTTLLMPPKTRTPQTKTACRTTSSTSTSRLRTILLAPANTAAHHQLHKERRCYWADLPVQSPREPSL